MSERRRAQCQRDEEPKRVPESVCNCSFKGSPSGDENIAMQAAQEKKKDTGIFTCAAKSNE